MPFPRKSENVCAYAVVEKKSVFWYFTTSLLWILQNSSRKHLPLARTDILKILPIQIKVFVKGGRMIPHLLITVLLLLLVAGLESEDNGDSNPVHAKDGLVIYANLASWSVRKTKCKSMNSGTNETFTPSSNNCVYSRHPQSRCDPKQCWRLGESNYPPKKHPRVPHRPER